MMRKSRARVLRRRRLLNKTAGRRSFRKIYNGVVLSPYAHYLYETYYPEYEPFLRLEDIPAYVEENLEYFKAHDGNRDGDHIFNGWAETAWQFKYEVPDEWPDWDMSMREHYESLSSSE